MVQTIEEYPRRRWWRKVPLVSTARRPRIIPEGTTETFPDAHANWVSILTFSWLNTIIAAGYTRPLDESELYTLPDHRRVQVYAKRLEQGWASRVAQANRKNEQTKSEENKLESASPSRAKILWWRLRRRDVSHSTANWRKRRQASPSLVWALNEVNLMSFWVGGAFKLIGDIATIVSPLLVRAILDYLNGPSTGKLGEGFGLAVGLFLLLTLAVIMNVHGFYRSYTTGIAVRGAIINVVFVRALRLSEQSKIRDGLSLSKLVTLISADASRIDFCCGLFHSAWTSIVQILVCLALMIYSLGYSALPGFALVALLYPTQSYMVRQLFALRRKSMKFTDARVNVVVEAISAIRLLKMYAWEKATLSRANSFRTQEMHVMKQRLLLRSFNMAISFTIPTLAVVLAFVTYQLSGPPIEGGDSGIIFSSFTFFLLLRTPLQMLPVALSSISDAKAAIERLTPLMQASEQQPMPPVDPTLPLMIEVKDASFVHYDEWVQMSSDGPSTDSRKEYDEKDQSQSRHSLRDITLAVPRGALVCLTGAVGSGKSSLIRALLRELHQTKGSCSIGGAIAYCPQTAWLFTGSIRDNILFGQDLDAARYQEVLQDCCLNLDLSTLVEGDRTVIGEKGISLSVGQRQRISLARAVYADAPLQILDDCFSALDAEVAHTVFQNITRSARRRGVTQLLATHSTRILPFADQIVHMENGRIVTTEYRETSTKEDGDKVRLPLTSGTSPISESATMNIEAEAKETVETAGSNKEMQHGKGAEVMQKEERLAGSVTADTYLSYLAMGKPLLTMPLFILAIASFQATSVLSPLWLVYWQEDRFTDLSSGSYMGIYAALGVGQSITLFAMSATFALFVYHNSKTLHASALVRILYAPISFFDTTPQGRITHRFSRDVDAVDNVVGETLRLFLSTMLQAIGSIVLVSIILPYFLAIAAFILLFYVYTGMYYRPASRELRRLNNLLRSPIYEHFNECLTGLSTLRAYGALDQSAKENARRIDVENKAYWLSIACQRWLNIRLDFFGALLCFGVALLVVGLRDTISPSSAGVVLSYIVTVQAMFGQMIRQSAEIENNMNSIERLLHYAKQIEQEDAPEKDSDKKLGADWPRQGEIVFSNVNAAHREGLPLILKGIDLHIQAGERIGIVGRTGSGKSTCECTSEIVTASHLYSAPHIDLSISTVLSSILRMMEVSDGQITIDGVDTRSIGLSKLRGAISVIGQEATMLKGTLRYNLDPMGQYEDIRLNDVLHQVQGPPSSIDEDDDEKNKLLHLDSEIAQDGQNISQGQRALISIARALLKQAKIVLIDEATASIDQSSEETIQDTLLRNLSNATVLMVAHRLSTVINFTDRIVVLSDRHVVETGTPSALFNQPSGYFRQLCDSSAIGEDALTKQ